MTPTPTLIRALRILARDIQSDDGIANDVIEEAALRLEELDVDLASTKAELDYARDALAKAKERIQELQHHLSPPLSTSTATGPATT